MWVVAIGLAAVSPVFAEAEDDWGMLASEVEATDEEAAEDDESEAAAEETSGFGNSLGWLVPGTGIGGARRGGNVEHVDRRLIFRGAEFWWKGGFSYAGALWSPDGLDREGFVLKSLIGAGSYRYRAGDVPITGYHAVLSLMPGWRFKGNGFETSVFVGADAQAHALVPNDPASRLRGVRAGPRLGIDVWLQPDPAFMLNGFATFSTVGPSYSVRGAFGWLLFDLVYIGPEAQAMGSDTYRHFRLGLHATGVVFGPYEYSAGLGYARDSDYRTGVYGRLGVIMRR